MKSGSLFSGCGGLDLGVELALGATPAWLCEFDPHARGVLERHFPGVPIIHDVREIDAGVARVDVMHGGYPCQPFSVAGRREGENDPRHLWPEFLRCIRLLRPGIVILENVAGHLALGFDTVLCDLAEMGMSAQWGVVRASDAGAPHKRERLFVVATDTGSDDSTGPGEGNTSETTEGRIYGRPKPARLDALAADAYGSGLEGVRSERGASDGQGTPNRLRASKRPNWGKYGDAITRWERITGRHAPRPTDSRGRLEPAFVTWMMGLPEGWVEGLPRTHALRILGNAVVPLQASLAVSVLLEA